MNKYVVASEALERMLSPDGTGTDGDFETRFQARCQEEFAGAHEQLTAMLAGRHERIDRFNAGHPDLARLKFERELQAVIDKYKTIPPKPTVEWVRDGTRCFFSEGFDPNAEGRRHGFDGWVRSDPPPAKSAVPNADLDAPSKPTTPPPEQTSAQPPLPPPSSAPPAHYLRQPDGSEPWRMAESGRRLSGKDWGPI